MQQGRGIVISSISARIRRSPTKESFGQRPLSAKLACSVDPTCFPVGSPPCPALPFLGRREFDV